MTKPSDRASEAESGSTGRPRFETQSYIERSRMTQRLPLPPSQAYTNVLWSTTFVLWSSRLKKDA